MTPENEARIKELQRIANNEHNEYEEIRVARLRISDFKEADAKALSWMKEQMKKVRGDIQERIMFLKDEYPNGTSEIGFLEELNSRLLFKGWDAHNGAGEGSVFLEASAPAHSPHSMSGEVDKDEINNSPDTYSPSDDEIISYKDKTVWGLPYERKQFKREEVKDFIKEARRGMVKVEDVLIILKELKPHRFERLKSAWDEAEEKIKALSASKGEGVKQ